MVTKEVLDRAREETPELSDEEIEAEGERYIEMLHEQFRGK
jgi:hypothetical protein